MVASAHHDSGDHFNGGAECSRDDAGDGSGVDEFDALGGGGGKGGEVVGEDGGQGAS